jgi:hypothetical protein
MQGQESLGSDIPMSGSKSLGSDILMSGLLDEPRSSD